MSDVEPGSSRTSREPIPDNWSTTGNGPGTTSKHEPDGHLYMDVCDRLMQFGLVDCTEIDVSVRGGVVLLSGTVATADIGHRITEVVRSVAGVQDVDNRLTVG